MIIDLSNIKPLLWLLPLLVISVIFKSARLKGALGERAVKRLINRNLNTSTYRVLSNVTLLTPEGETTQIDHICVSPFGVLVIETKNMSGWIFGGKNQAQWTQTIYQKKYKFQNPLRQNYKHIKALEYALDLPQETLKSIIVFAGNCKFKTEIPDGVCVLADLIEYIHSIDVRILSDFQISAIYDRIQSQRLVPSYRVNRNHIRSLRRKYR